ncbi:hypothetical protein HO173_000390 [Letharia columbiana]|uniref:BTB domain-containing protein n=1 Tax=Letharia columbiana TaxID=112416 RepID=A0A8H6LAN9_9LECA|nr:uncharacterized protein HO173_000390 [Letharia columbiana]KAF6241679.1 hypothetical protein HO173_000390 [Letharia columbiana]
MTGTQSAAATDEGSPKQESADEQTPFLYDTMVVVLVGPVKQRFEIHKRLICSRSDFFKAAFTGNFKEADDGTLTLPEEDPATFKYFVYWLYTGSLRGFHYSKSLNPSLKELTNKVRSEVISRKLLHAEWLPLTNPHRKLWEHANYRDLPFASLIALYILADALQVPRLKDAGITALVEVYGFSSTDKGHCKMYWAADGPDDVGGPMEGINMAWETLPKESNFCQLLLQLFCDNTDGIYDAGDGISYHAGFVLSMANLFAYRWVNDLPPTDWTKTGAICSFHEHEGASCDLTEDYLEDRKAMARE